MTLSSEAATLTGRVQFIGRAPGVTVSTIVYAEALDGSHAQPGKFKMEQKNKAFVPHVLAVPVGSTVTFPNEDLIFHNAFSLSRPGPFDFGLYRDGESRSRTFTAPATYRIYCNIHPQMSAILLVLPTSHITEADATGNYRLDLPPGRYRLTAWSERADPASVEVTVSSGSQTDLMLDESRFIESQHKNKFGQDYPKK
jgi:plastocyanin